MAKRKPILLIDGDEVLYRATTSVEHETRWDEENHVLHSNAEEAWEAFNRIILGFQEAIGVSDFRLAFTKGDSFRKGLYDPYKANRLGVRKPLCYVAVRERAEEAYQTYSYPGLEADDILGIWATRGGNLDPIIVSQDKDLKTIPGKLWRQGALEVTSEEAANYNWMYQTLIGDTSDGYPGCPGVGPKTAEKILHHALDGFGSMGIGSTLQTMWPEIIRTYEKNGLTAEDALLQARLARILRASDWDAQNKEVRLWTPSQ